MIAAPLVRLHLTTDTVEAEREVRLGDGSFTVRFRPVAPAEHRAHMREAAGRDAAGQAVAEAELLSRLLTDWNVAGPDGLKLPLTPDAIRTLPQAAFNALFAEVMLYTGAAVLGNSAAS